MGAPENKLSAGEERDAVPANENAKQPAVAGPDSVLVELAGLEAQAVLAQTRAQAALEQATAVLNGINGFKANLIANSYRASAAAPDAKAEITGFPARHLSRELRKFHKVSDRDRKIYLGKYNHPRIGLPLDWFVGPENFIATPDKAMFEIMPSMKASKDGHGHDGMVIDPSRDYDDQVIGKLKDGSGRDQWFAMSWLILGGRNYPRSGEAKVFTDNLMDHWDEGDLVQATSIDASGSFGQEFFGSSTPTRNDRDYVLIAHRRNGDVGNAHRRANHVRWLPVLAQG